MSAKSPDFDELIMIDARRTAKDAATAFRKKSLFMKERNSTMITQEMVRVMARAIAESLFYSHGFASTQPMTEPATDALKAVYPLILEQAAKAASLEPDFQGKTEFSAGYEQGRNAAAQKIRDMQSHIRKLEGKI